MQSFEILFGSNQNPELPPIIVSSILLGYRNQLNNQQIQNVYERYKNDESIIEDLLISQNVAFAILKDEIKKDGGDDIVLHYEATLKYVSNPSLVADLLLNHGVEGKIAGLSILSFIGGSILFFFFYENIFSLFMINTDLSIIIAPFSAALVVVILHIPSVMIKIRELGLSMRRSKIEKIKKEMMKA